MKNMAVAKKMIVSFLIITSLCAYVGIMGILGMSQVNNDCLTLYTEQTKPLPDIAKTIEHIQLLRIYTRDTLLYSDDITKLKITENNILVCIQELETYIANYDSTIKDEQSRKSFDNASNLYFDVLKPSIFKIVEDCKNGLNSIEMLDNLEELRKTNDLVLSELTLCMNNKVAGGQNAYMAVKSLFIVKLINITVIIIICIVVALLLAFYISKMISRPINKINEYLHRFGTLGDYVMTDDELELYEKRSKDEIGQCQVSLNMVVNRLHEIGNVLNEVENGNLTSYLEPLSEKDIMGHAINQVLKSLNKMFSELNMTSSQVSLGAGHVSQSAQNLATGSAQQAATIQELTVSLTELKQHTGHNAQNAAKARGASEKSSTQLSDSMRSMDEVMVAMDSIYESSSKITKVIAFIDDIAFQTNIIALNAAIEAAHAGVHGRGFAVVAEEVRNLAKKSAAAAKETATLIKGSSNRVKEGNQIVLMAKSSLEMVAEYAHELTNLIDEVAEASMEQSKTITDVNRGLEQFSQVVQANSATAQASAAASEEMSSQAALLDEIVARFNILPPSNKWQNLSNMLIGESQLTSGYLSG